MKTKPILFIDFDGTLCHDRYWRSLDKNMFSIVQDTLFGNDNTLVVEWMVGKKSAEEVNTILAKKLQVPFPDLWEVFVDDCETMKVNLSTLNTINSLRTQYKTILITGNMDNFSRFTVPALQLDTYFDEIINSADAGSLKSDPSGKQFLDPVQRHSANISECVLIDDSQRICNFFESLGGTSLLVTKENTLNKYLAEIGKRKE